VNARGAPLSHRKMSTKAIAFLFLAALVAGCASNPQRNIAAGMSESEVGSRFGKPVAAGRLPSGEEYWDYSTQPYGFVVSRVTFTPERRVREVRNLLTEQNFKSLHNGMTRDEVVAVVGPADPWWQRNYAGGTASWTYRYRDGEVIKLLNLIFDPSQRVAAYYTEWDPSVYSKGDGKNSSGK
jgi:outer membrane protein assembly factor BamE (lipoprotein component of BamABCDE complex)